MSLKREKFSRHFHFDFGFCGSKRRKKELWMKIKAITFNQTAAPRRNKWFTTYHNCINSSRCNKLFGLIFLMSIGAIFTAVIVTSIIRADLFEQDNDDSSFSNTTQEIPDVGNSMQDATEGMLESFNNSHGGFQSFDEMITSGDDKEKNLDDENGTTSNSTLTTTTVETTSTTLTVPTLVPKCTVQTIGSNRCQISCFGVQGDCELENELKRAIDEDIDSFSCFPNDVRLFIENSSFGEGYGLDPNWLDDLHPSNGVIITELTIANSNFRTLQANTFVNGPFTAIKELKIYGMRELVLRNGSFDGLTNLTKLMISEIDNLVLRNESCCLLNLWNIATLTNLEITLIKNSFSISRLIGRGQHENLSEIKLSQNNFTNLTSQSFDFAFLGASNSVKKIFMDSSEITELNGNMFTNCTNLDTITLMNNRITSIPPNIFQGLPKLELIWLQNNQLKNLPNDFLVEFMNTSGPPIRLGLQNNTWDCSLEILHLKNLILDSRISVQQNQTVTCSAPLPLRGKQIKDLWCFMEVDQELCITTCVNMNNEVLDEQLSNLNMTSCASIKLELTGHTFEGKTLPQNWLSHLHYNISWLEICSTLLISFGSFAFNSTTFYDLKVLSYDGNGITVENNFGISRESFYGLRTLEYLKISTIPQLQVTPQVSPQVFQEISATVRKIAITNVVDRFFIRNVIGSSTYENLEVLILNGNSFEESTFSEGTFNGTYKCLKELYMMNSKIKTIDSEAFNSFEVLTELHLQDNQIVSLPHQLFVNIKKVQPTFMVYLDNNPLNCTDACHLLPFESERVICASPEKYQNQTLSVIRPNCEASITMDTEPTSEEGEESTPELTTTTESTTTTENSTESVTTPQETTEPETTTNFTEDPATSSSASLPTTTLPTTTTKKPDSTSTAKPENNGTTTSFSETTTTEEETTLSSTTLSLPGNSTPQNPGGSPLEIRCFDNSTYIRFFNNSKLADNILQRESITVYRPPVLFSIETSGPNEVKITFERMEEGIVMLFYPVSFNPFDGYEDDLTDVQCLAVQQEILFIGNLLANTVYTFCSLFQIPIFTPFQCVSHVNNKGMPWLYEEQKVIIVTSLTLILLLALITGIIMTYFLIRRMPTLIRGSKRVVIVNNRAKEVMILPRSNNDDSRRSSYRKESVATPIVHEPPTYLTPLPRQSIDRPPLVRSNSETSVKSYVSVSRLPPRYSQGYQRGDFESNHMARHRSYSRQLPLAPFEQSPELPPPLPRRSIVSTASSAHNSIASTAEIGKLSRSGNHHNSTFRHRPSRVEVQEENLYNVII